MRPMVQNGITERMAVKPSKDVPPKADEYEWIWKVGLIVIQKAPLALCNTAGARGIETNISL